MSRIVIGGAHFRSANQKFVDQLLDCAHDLGISTIDTAPSYGNSEILIGDYVGRKGNFRINTKVGMPDPSRFNPLGIIEQVKESSKRLGSAEIDTLFIHSLDRALITDENISSLLRLKKLGYVRKLGYSGDGKNLSFAKALGVFDSYMATFNPIDIGNKDELLSLGSEKDVYLKRILAGGIWKRRFKSALKNKLYLNTLHRDAMSNKDSYYFRYHKIFGKQKYFESKLDLFSDLQ
jgi:aryl-alcohol dehydrogenase-like predicted oxidoreductase